ncbi:MAG: hypothetical protein AB1513_01370 [Pseudomonadota bacterium]
MRAAIAIVLCAHLGLLAGCAISERYYGNVYEGLKTREAIVHPSVEQKPAEKSMSYQEYESERKKLLESNDNK